MKEDLREEIEVRDGQLIGALRSPVNPMRKAEGSIHDEDEARKLGFRGGLIAGSIHMEQLAPVLANCDTIWYVRARAWSYDPDGYISGLLHDAYPHSEVTDYDGVTVERLSR